MLAYISDEVDLINQIFIADPDGANKRQISNYAGPDNIMHVAWSSDESRIFATLVAGDGGQSIHEVPAQGGERSRSSTVGEAPPRRAATVESPGCVNSNSDTR
ncbi:MAG: hypothetical protein R2845_05790 [Thermomicrobiales bacterium]